MNIQQAATFPSSCMFVAAKRRATAITPEGAPVVGQMVAIKQDGTVMAGGPNRYLKQSGG
jgi:hypothetical protein